MRIPRLKLPRRISWEWSLCTLVIIALALFLLGHNMFGLSGYLSSLLALLGLLMAPLLTTLVFPLVNFLLITFIAPLVGLLLTALASLAAAVVALLAPVLAALGSLWAWLLSTAIGQAVIAPVYNMLAPIILKVAPWLTTGRYATTVWKFLQRYIPKQLTFLRKKP